VTLTAPRGVGYRRVSTTEQSASGLGLEAQETAIEIAATRLGITVTETYTDAGLSGGLPLEQRPGLMAALHVLRKGDFLLVAKRDRLGRDVLNVAMLERLAERKGARVVSAAGEGTDTDDPTSRLMRQIVDCFAEYERAIIRARTRAALHVKKARGERVGGIPFGYRLADDGRRLAPDPNEQSTLRLLSELRSAGHSYRAIAGELNRRGFRSRTGRAWVHQSVHTLAKGGGDEACL
jgi:DNA invertase Pin-like site-specific DNA recombinase